MAPPKTITTVAQYLAAQAAPMRALVKTARATIRATVPAATEDIAYGLIRFKLDGEMLLYIAGWKKHWSLYPAYPSVVKALEGEPGNYTLVQKTLRFEGTDAVPTKLVAKIAKLRATEVRGAPLTKKAAKKPTAQAKKTKKTRAKARKKAK